MGLFDFFKRNRARPPYYPSSAAAGRESVFAEVQVYYRKIADENGRTLDLRSVKAEIDGEKLTVKCLDINDSAQSMFGERDVEFYLKVGENGFGRLLKSLEKKERIKLESDSVLRNQQILGFFKSRFGESNDSFEDIMRFFKANKIKHDYHRW